MKGYTPMGGQLIIKSIYEENKNKFNPLFEAIDQHKEESKIGSPDVAMFREKLKQLAKKQGWICLLQLKLGKYLCIYMTNYLKTVFLYLVIVLIFSIVLEFVWEIILMKMKIMKL